MLSMMNDEIDSLPEDLRGSSGESIVKCLLRAKGSCPLRLRLDTYLPEIYIILYCKLLLTSIANFFIMVIYKKN